MYHAEIERGTRRALQSLRLYGTPLSHFTRKIRILLAEMGVSFEFVRPTSLLDANPASYGDNPLMRVPTLVHGDLTVLDSDHIARYLVATFDRKDWFEVNTTDVGQLDRLAVANGVMSNEVVLILAKRGGLTDLESVAYFRKLLTAIDSGLAWLDAHSDPTLGTFDYADIALICMWQHLLHYQLAQGLDRYSRIAARVARFADRPSVTSTTPERSLADAAAAGWKPA